MNHLCAAIVFIIGEFICIYVFNYIKKTLGPDKERSFAKLSIWKGILERLVMFIGLIYGYPQILIVFGALKLGTRLHQDKDDNITNNYFLVGNFVSLLMAMIYTIVTKRLSLSF
jgi:hypothetical protein